MRWHFALSVADYRIIYWISLRASSSLLITCSQGLKYHLPNFLHPNQGRALIPHPKSVILNNTVSYLPHHYCSYSVHHSLPFSSSSSPLPHPPLPQRSTLPTSHARFSPSLHSSLHPFCPSSLPFAIPSSLLSPSIPRPKNL